MSTTQYAAYDEQAIWGTGTTPEAAIADCAEWTECAKFARLHVLKTAPMTPALAKRVAFGGGGIPFGRLPSGELCTVLEEEASNDN